MNRIEQLLIEMESISAGSGEWFALEDEFLESIERFRSPKLKASYIRRYAYMGENDPRYSERSFKDLMASFREEIPEVRERFPFLGGQLA